MKFVSISKLLFLCFILTLIIFVSCDNEVNPTLNEVTQQDTPIFQPPTDPWDDTDVQLSSNQVKIDIAVATLNEDGTVFAEAWDKGNHYYETYTPTKGLETANVDNTRHLYTVLTEGERLVYHAYLNAAQGDGGTDKYSFWPPTNKNEYINAYNSFVNDYPEFFAISGNYTTSQFGECVVHGEIFSIPKKDSTYTNRDTEIKNSLEEIKKKVKDWVTIHKAGNNSPEAYLEAIFWVLNSHIKYDDRPNVGFWVGVDGHPHTIYGPLVLQKGVCEGYAKTYAYVAQQMGYGDYVATLVGKSKASSSYDISHVWNAVKLNRTWYQIDLTWTQWITAFSHGEHLLTGSSATWWDKVSSQN